MRRTSHVTRHVIPVQLLACAPRFRPGHSRTTATFDCGDTKDNDNGDDDDNDNACDENVNDSHNESRPSAAIHSNGTFAPARSAAQGVSTRANATHGGSRAPSSTTTSSTRSSCSSCASTHTMPTPCTDGAPQDTSTHNDTIPRDDHKGGRARATCDIWVGGGGL